MRLEVEHRTLLQAGGTQVALDTGTPPTLVPEVTGARVVAQNARKLSARR